MIDLGVFSYYGRSVIENDSICVTRAVHVTVKNCLHSMSYPTGSHSFHVTICLLSLRWLLDLLWETKDECFLILSVTYSFRQLIPPRFQSRQTRFLEGLEYHPYSATCCFSSILILPFFFRVQRFSDNCRPPWSNSRRSFHSEKGDNPDLQLILF